MKDGEGKIGKWEMFKLYFESEDCFIPEVRLVDIACPSSLGIVSAVKETPKSTGKRNRKKTKRSNPKKPERTKRSNPKTG